MSKKIWVLGGAAILAVAAVAWIVVRSRIGPLDATLRIGAIIPLSGPFAAYGEPVRDGVLMAVDEINAAGGIGGRRIELALEDDAGNPTSAVSAFTRLATVSSVPVVVGPLSSGASMATAPLADRYHVVQLSTLAGTIDLTNAGDYVFRIYPSSEVGSRYIARVAVERFRARRVAILYPNNPFGVASRRFVAEVMQQNGVNVVAVETYNDGDRDFRTQIAKIVRSRPDLVLCSAYYEEGAQILVQAQQLGLTVPILGEDGWFGPIAGTAGGGLQRLYFANVAVGTAYSDNAAMQGFVRAFEARFRRAATSYSAAGYAAIYVVKHAIEAGGYSGEGIKNALYQTDMLTAFGRVKFDANGDNVGAIYDLFQLNERNEAIPASTR